MSSRRNSAESLQALNTLLCFVENWAVENGDKLRRSCASCVYAQRTGPFKCSLYNMTPPLDTIMDGCNEYSDKEVIPF